MGLCGPGCQFRDELDVVRADVSHTDPVTASAPEFDPLVGLQGCSMFANHLSSESNFDCRTALKVQDFLAVGPKGGSVSEHRLAWQQTVEPRQPLFNLRSQTCHKAIVADRLRPPGSVDKAGSPAALAFFPDAGHRHIFDG